MRNKYKHRSNRITKADKEAMKSDNRIERDFEANEPLINVVTDITEVKTANGKLYVSVI